jgi:molybdenum cofactor biosynthesis enzyme MoaA
MSNDEQKIRKNEQQPKYIETRIQNPVDYYTYQFLRKFKKSINDSELFQNFQEIINRSEEKNTLKLKLSTNTYNLTYNDRKYLVYGLSIASLALHSLRNKFRVRVLIPYYVFWSTLFCHENLNPYI